MYEVPDWEELRGTDPNDAKHFEPKGSGPAVITGPKCNRWFVVARIGDEPKRPSLALKIDSDEMFWWRPTGKSTDSLSKTTVFDDLDEAWKAKFAAEEKFPELTVWLEGYTVKE